MDRAKAKPIKKQWFCIFKAPVMITAHFQNSISNYIGGHKVLPKKSNNSGALLRALITGLLIIIYIIIIITI
ncbi:MAG: hypothetical protein DRR19_22055 [Candidatus Parabeggiatoa sp. nov. 1]|nr:MAG: hypothetical protein DRR19_22055 [Gammaproteobacteria bacterium]